MRLTVPTLLVLRALQKLQEQGELPYGLEVMKASKLKSGTVYPILKRLEDEGYLTSKTETAKSARLRGRPPRICYQFTAKGKALLKRIQPRLKELGF